MTSPSNIGSSHLDRDSWSSANKTLSLVETRCIVCGSAAAEPVAVGYDFEYDTVTNEFRFVSCQGCGHVYLNPRPAAADLDVIYPPTYVARCLRQKENTLPLRPTRNRWLKYYGQSMVMKEALSYVALYDWLLWYSCGPENYAKRNGRISISMRRNGATW